MMPEIGENERNRSPKKYNKAPNRKKTEKTGIKEIK